MPRRQWRYNQSHNIKWSWNNIVGELLGPLAGFVNGKVAVVGVTSWGRNCALPPFPGVYARVTAQKAWILANSDAGNCQN